jgi:chaperonin cofactor prefoldin
MAKELTAEELIRERDFFKVRSENLAARVKQLEYECAELQRRESDLNQRLKELSYQKVIQYRQSHQQRRNFVKR